MIISYFKDIFGRKVTTKELTHEELLLLVRSTRAKTKKQLPLYNGCEFGNKPNDDGCLRWDGNVLRVHTFVGDYDGEEISLRQSAALFRKLGIQASLYSTPSSTADKPRWRATSPLRVPKDPAAWRKFVPVIQTAFGNIFGQAEAKTLSLSYFLGSVSGGIETEIVEGGFIDEVLEKNPYLSYDTTALHSIAGVDVDAELAAMAYRDKDYPIHNTQLRCVASMLSSGEDPDFVMERVLEATRRACDDAGQVWGKWKPREVRSIQEMIDSWLKKLEKSNVVDFKTAKALPGGGRTGDGKTKINKKNLHVELAKMYVREVEEAGGGIIRLDEEWWMCRGGCWGVQSSRAGDELIERQIDELMKSGGLVPTQKVIREVLAQVRHVTGRDSVPWDEHGLLPVRNGMLDLKTHQLRPCAPGDYARRQLPVAYDPTAQCPVWLKMLSERFDQGTIEVLQENLGAALLPKRNKDQRRALILVGPSNGGKSSYLNVACALLSSAPIGVNLSEVDKPHGTMPFRDKFAPWRLDEAFQHGVWHPTSTTKAILSGEPFSLNVKNGPMLTISWDGACYWATNVPAAFREATKAMENRIIIVDCSVVFDPKQTAGAAAVARSRGYKDPDDLVIVEEMSGVLNWALDGAKRIAERGHYELTRDLEENLSTFREDSNPLVSFFRECVEYDPESRVSVADFHHAFSSFVRDEMRTVPSTKALGRLLKSMGDARVAVDNSQLKSGNRRFYAGVKLNDFGLDHWLSRVAEISARGWQVPGTSDSVERVNGEIPATWVSLSTIIRMQKAHKIKRPNH